MVILLSSAERLLRQFSVPLEIISLPSRPRRNEYSHSKHVLNFLSLVFIKFNKARMTHKIWIIWYESKKLIWLNPSLSGSTGPEVPDGLGGERSMLSPVKSLQLFPVQRYSFPIWTDSGAAAEGKVLTRVNSGSFGSMRSIEVNCDQAVCLLLQLRLTL